MKTTNGKDNRLIKKTKGKSYYEWEGEQELVEQKLRNQTYDFPYEDEARRMEWPTKGRRISIHKIAALNHLKAEVFGIIQKEVPSMSVKSVQEWIVWCRYHITLGIDGFWGEDSNRKEHMRLMNRFLGVLMERYEELYDDTLLDAQRNEGENREWRNKDLWDVPKFIQVNVGN